MATTHEPWHTEKVMALNEPQIWTLIGVFAAVMIGGMTFMFRLVTTTLDAKFGSMDSKFDSLDSKFDAVNDSIASLRTEMNARFEMVDTKIEHLDRDVQALSKHVFNDRE